MGARASQKRTSQQFNLQSMALYVFDNQYVVRFLHKGMPNEHAPYPASKRCRRVISRPGRHTLT